jgi:hypothetical protein
MFSRRCQVNFRSFEGMNDVLWVSMPASIRAFFRISSSKASNPPPFLCPHGRLGPLQIRWEDDGPPKCHPIPCSKIRGMFPRHSPVRHVWTKYRVPEWLVWHEKMDQDVVCITSGGILRSLALHPEEYSERIPN